MTFAATFCGNVVDWREGDTRYSGNLEYHIKGFGDCEVSRIDGVPHMHLLSNAGHNNLLTNVREEKSCAN